MLGHSPSGREGVEERLGDRAGERDDTGANARLGDAVLAVPSESAEEPEPLLPFEELPSLPDEEPEPRPPVIARTRPETRSRRYTSSWNSSRPI